MNEIPKQTWVVRYLRIDGEHRKLPCSYVATVEGCEYGEARSRAVAQYHAFARENNLTTLFLDAERIG